MEYAWMLQSTRRFEGEVRILFGRTGPFGSGTGPDFKATHPPVHLLRHGWCQGAVIFG